MSSGFTSGPDSNHTAIATIRRGLREAPVLRSGLWLTFLLAAIGSGGRVVVPILIQQAIDRGIVGVDGPDVVDVGLVARQATIGLVAVMNVIEFLLARDLLLFGAANAIFAAGFIAFVIFTERTRPCSDR